MMKKWLALMLMALLLPCCALAQDAASVPGGYIQFSGELPETLLPAFSGEEWADDKPLTGYVFTRFDEWSYADVIMEGDTGRTLCCLFWFEDHWELTASSAAIPQDGTPVLEIEELEWYKTEEERDQFNLGYEFNVYFEDSASPVTWFRWFHGSNGWRLQSMIGYQQSISFATRTLEWNGEPIYNKQDILLENFVLADFPATVEEARAIAEADPVLNDRTAGVTVYPEGTYIYDWDVAPGIPVYATASGSAEKICWMFQHTEVKILDERNGFVQVIAGNITIGWIPRENVKIGLERVSEFLFQQRVRVLCEPGAETEPVYDAPGGTVCGEISTRKAVGIVTLSLDGKWAYVLDKDTGVCGYIPGGKAALTDNFATCVVFNDKPENRLHLRAAPSKNADSLGKYYTGVVVDMLWQEQYVSGWRKVSVGGVVVDMLWQEQYVSGWRKVSVGGVVGWMNAEYLSFASNGNYSGYLPPLRQVRGAVGGEGANMRASADTNAAIVRRLQNGTPVEILGISGDWGHIRLKDSTTGWMRLHLLGGEPEKADAWTVKLLADAMDDAGLNVVFPAGTKVCLAERPAAYWHCPNWREGDWETVEFRVPDEVVIFKDDVSARIPLDAIDCGW